jgi:hypothetical protein
VRHEPGPKHRWKFVRWVKGYPHDRCACGVERLKEATRVSHRQMLRTVYRRPGGEWGSVKPPHAVEAAA